MTSEEKAKELTAKFKCVTSALICVDEILNLQKSTGKWLPVVVPDSIKYWVDVKEAILKQNPNR